MLVNRLSLVLEESMGRVNSGNSLRRCGYLYGAPGGGRCAPAATQRAHRSRAGRRPDRDNQPTESPAIR